MTIAVAAAVLSKDAARTELEKSIKMAAVVVDQLLKSSGGEASFDLSTVESEGTSGRPISLPLSFPQNLLGCVCRAMK